MEPGAVVLGHGREVLVERELHQLKGVHGLLRPGDEDEDIAEPGRLLEALQVAVERDDRLAERPLGLAHPRRGRLELGVGAGDVAGDAVLDLEELDNGLRLHPSRFLDPRQVAQPEALELPERLIAQVGAAEPLVQAAVLPESEDPRLDRLVGRLKAVDHQCRRQRPRLLAAEDRDRFLHERLVHRQLGPVRQRDRQQVVERARRVDERDLEVVVLQRNDHGAGVEPQDLREVGRVHAPGLPRRGGALLEVGQEVARPVDLDPRHQVATQAGDSGDELMPARDGVERPGVHAAGAMDLEVGVGGLKQRIVLGPLHVPVRRVQGLPRGQGREERVGQRHVLPHAAAGPEEVDAGGGHDALVEVGPAAVVADVVEAHVERGHPEHLGARELALGHPDARLRGRDDQRPRVGKPKRRREVDRELEVARRERRGVEVGAGGEVAGGRRGRRLPHAGQRGGQGGGVLRPAEPRGDRGRPRQQEPPGARHRGVGSRRQQLRRGVRGRGQDRSYPEDRGPGGSSHDPRSSP